MRFLCIDLGDKRTGIAAGDDVTRIVSPVRVVETPIGSGGGEALLAELAKEIAEHAPDSVVVGLPLNMDGTEGPRAKLARQFGTKLAGRVKAEVVYHDERLSSDAADDAMARTGLTHKQKKARRDALAACAVLRDYLNSHGARPAGDPDGGVVPDQSGPD